MTSKVGLSLEYQENNVFSQEVRLSPVTKFQTLNLTPMNPISGGGLIIVYPVKVENVSSIKIKNKK